MKEIYEEPDECIISSLLRRVSVLEQELKQWERIVMIMNISVLVLTITLIISKLG